MTQSKLPQRIALGMLTGLLVGIVYEILAEPPGIALIGLAIWLGVGALMGAIHRHTDVASGGIIGIGVGMSIGRNIGGWIAPAAMALLGEIVGAQIAHWLGNRTGPTEPTSSE